MTGSEIFGDIGTIVGIAALIFALYEFRQRVKIEKVFKTFIQSFPGDIALIERNCQWGNTNVRNAVDALNQIPDSDAKQNLHRLLMLSSGNTMAGRELCRTVFSNLLAFQSAQFGSRDIVYTGSDEFELCQKEKRPNQLPSRTT
jgi:hypothetical protein